MFAISVNEHDAVVFSGEVFLQSSHHIDTIPTRI